MVDTDVTTKCETETAWRLVLGSLFSDLVLKPGELCMRGDMLIIRTRKGPIYVHHGPYTLIDEAKGPESR